MLEADGCKQSCAAGEACPPYSTCGGGVCRCNAGAIAAGEGCWPETPREPTSHSEADVCAVYKWGQVSVQDANPAWTKGPTECDGGTLPGWVRHDVSNRVSMYRWLAGLGPSVVNVAIEKQEMACAAAASWNVQYGHNIPASAKCYTPEGASGAASSNIAWGNTGTAAVDAWVDDRYDITRTFGHRFSVLSEGAWAHRARSRITLHTDAAVPIGTALLHTALIDPLTGDTTPANNTITVTDTVVGSYDPNDKLLDTRTATLSEVLADDLDLTYTIRFQDTGTFPAERVVIVDTLSDQLQWSTFQFLGSSHTCDWYMLDGVLHFIFDPIQLPDSGSDEAASHGFLRFSMRPSTQLQLGESVSNIAHILFDFNAPIVTPPAVFLVDNATSVIPHSNTELIVMPNPTRDRLRLDGFSGPARYRIRG